MSEPSAHSRNDQILYFSLMALATITLAIARLLHPSAKGYGTHQQLGLPPCVFFQLTGIPCPSCGLTTSFAHAARLHFYQAFLTQPFGLIAFCLTVASIPIFAHLIRRRVAWQEAIRARGVHVMFYLLLGIYLLSWLYKIMMVRNLGFGS
ncbi:MAG: DUF2752 domain-containing protein [Acidobacteriota bacterium]